LTPRAAEPAPPPDETAADPRKYWVFLQDPDFREINKLF
jgi:hypothetical protein